MKLFLTLSLMVAIAATSHGHALWIETATSGRKNVTQKVKVFFGEFSTKETTPTAKWYSNLRDLKIFLTTPNGTRLALKTKAEALYLEVSFTPTQDGQYALSIGHQVKDTYENSKLDYYALANVFVGMTTRIHPIPKEILLSISPTKPTLKAGQSNPHFIKLGQKSFKNRKIALIGPNKEITFTKTDANGLVNFVPKAKGAHFFEAIHEEKKEGKLEGKSYNKIWRVTTYTLNAS